MDRHERMVQMTLVKRGNKSPPEHNVVSRFTLEQYFRVFRGIREGKNRKKNRPRNNIVNILLTSRLTTPPPPPPDNEIEHRTVIVDVLAHFFIYIYLYVRSRCIELYCLRADANTP